MYKLHTLCRPQLIIYIQLYCNQYRLYGGSKMVRFVRNPSRPDDVQIKGIIFDMDGTLCLPQTYMFKQMREALGIGKEIDILDHVHSLPPDQEEEAQGKLRAIEREAMVDMVPQPGLKELMDYLQSNNIPKSICTRNFPIPVNHLLDNFLSDHEFGPLVTREFKPPKPKPDGILHIASHWQIDPKNIVMVGDSIDDMKAGHAAGATTILLQSDVNEHLTRIVETDVVVDRLDDLINLLENGIEKRGHI